MKALTQEELNKRIELHELWVSSEGKEGEQLALNGYDLSGLDFKGANLTEAFLYNTNLTDADLSNTNLTKAYLHKSILINADLSNANLFGANFIIVDLTNANLEKTNYGYTTFIE